MNNVEDELKTLAPPPIVGKNRRADRDKPSHLVAAKARALGRRRGDFSALSLFRKTVRNYHDNSTQ